MSRRIRVAVIGCGGIGRTHGRALEANWDLAELVACADVVPEIAEAYGQSRGCRAYSDPVAMLDEVSPDAVVIGTPTGTHLPLVRLATERGIDVLCEKPLARSEAEAREMVAAVEASGIVFMNALCHRFHGPLNQARQLLRDGLLGVLVHLDNRFAVDNKGVEQKWHSRKSEGGGGVITEEAVHSFDMFRYIVGEVAEVTAHVHTTLPIDVEDNAVISLRSVDGVLGSIFVSWVTPPGSFGFDLYGTEGMAVVDYRATPNLRYRLRGGDWVEVPYEGPDRFCAEMRHFLECVRDRCEPLITVHDGLRTLELIEQAYRSAGVPR